MGGGKSPNRLPLITQIGAISRRKPMVYMRLPTNKPPELVIIDAGEERVIKLTRAETEGIAREAVVAITSYLDRWHDPKS